METKKKTWTVTAYRCELGDTLEAEPKTPCFRYRKVIFRKDEKPAREIIFSTDGSERAVILFEYDEGFRLLSKETLYLRDRSSEKLAFRYDEHGNKTEEIQYYDGELYDRCEMYYDEHDLQREKVHFDEQNSPFERDVYEYNEQGKLVRHTHLDEENTRVWEILTEYDAEGRVIAEINNRIQEQTAEMTSYTYNEKGLKIRSETKDLSGEVVGSVVISYNDKDLPTRYVSETYGFSPSKMVNQVVYDDQDRAITNEYYDVIEGMLVLREHIAFDENGNIREEEMYEVNTEKDNAITHYRLQMAYEYYLPEAEETEEKVGEAQPV